MNRALQILYRRKGILIAGAAAGIVLAVLMFTVATAARYEASAVILINNDNGDPEGLTYENLLASQRLAEYFGYFYHRGIYLDEAYRRLNITPETYEKIFRTLQVEIEKNTGIITVTMQNEGNSGSVKHLENICNVMMGKFQELTGVDNIKLISVTQSEEPVRKGLLAVFILVGLPGGLVVSYLLAVIVENSGNTIKSAEDAGKFFSIPVLGVIPRFGADRRGQNAGKAL